MSHNRPLALRSPHGPAQHVFEEDEAGASEDDRGLIERCRRGELEAFAGLVVRHQERLYGAVASLVECPEDARDVVQEAFLHAYQHLSSFKGDAQFYTWLYRIAANAAVSLRRKRRPVLLDELAGAKALPEPGDRTEASQPGYGAEREEREQTVRRALARLAPRQRAVLVMKDMEGMKYEEIAEVLGVAVGTVRSRLHRARLQLRALLEQAESPPLL